MRLYDWRSSLRVYKSFFTFGSVTFCYHCWSLSYSILQDSSLTGCHDVRLWYFDGHSGYRLVNPILSSALLGTLRLGKRKQVVKSKSEVCSPVAGLLDLERHSAQQPWNSGVLHCGGNILILDLWGDKGAPHMQALHFSFALGAFVAPLLAKLVWATSASTQNNTESGFDPLILNRSSEAASDSLFAAPEDVNLLWAYASIGTYILVVSVFLFGLFCKKRSKQEKSMASAQEARRAKYHRALLCLLFLFFFFYVGAEVTYGSYIFSFATTHVGMEESEAAGLNSIFWGTFAACRGLAIFFATLLQPGTMIVLCNIGSLTSSLFLVLFDKSPLCLWIATSVYGASMAATFPSGISWIEQYTTLTGKSAAFFVVGAALGEMAIPGVIGILQGHYPELPVVLYTGLGSAICTAVLFPVMYKLATLPLGHQPKGRKSEDQRALLSSSELNDCEEENEEEDAEKWNEMDFEVVEMSDPVQESVRDTSRDALIAPTPEVPDQFLSNAYLSVNSSNSLGSHQDPRD
ncbi:hypothetical protein STEG23_018541 [Scotinomys teguina]